MTDLSRDELNALTAASGFVLMEVDGAYRDTSWNRHSRQTVGSLDRRGYVMPCPFPTPSGRRAMMITSAGREYLDKHYGSK